MTGYISEVGYRDSDRTRRFDLPVPPVYDPMIQPYQSQVAPYNGWDRYKNAISGNYNRRVCPCPGNGFSQAPGIYDVRLAAPQPYVLKPLYSVKQRYIDPRYVDYHTDMCFSSPTDWKTGQLKPYVKGNWPDEQR